MAYHGSLNWTDLYQKHISKTNELEYSSLATPPCYEKNEFN